MLTRASALRLITKFGVRINVLQLSGAAFNTIGAFTAIENSDKSGTNSVAYERDCYVPYTRSIPEIGDIITKGDEEWKVDIVDNYEKNGLTLAYKLRIRR